MTAGLILAGGASRRFGSDKSLAQFDGMPLLDWAMAILHACNPLAVSTVEGSAVEMQAKARGMTVVTDALAAGLGPLAGIRMGLVWSIAHGSASIAVIPCDMPLLSLTLTAQLEAKMGHAPASYALTEDGPQPLCSIWRVDLIRELDAMLESGQHPSIISVLIEVGAVAVHFEDSTEFRNVNTRDELSQIQGLRTRRSAP